MYEKFFGFQRRPFELVPDPDFLYLGESHEAALANLVLGIDSGRGVVAISGEVGTGKTTVLRTLMRRLGRERPTCYLSQSEFGAKELLQSVLDGFDLPCDGLDKVTMRRRIRDHLRASPRAGVLIVDEAHLLSEESLEHVRLLSNLEEDNRKLLQIILAGQPELKVQLSGPRLRPLAQRIEMFYEIEALATGETAAYVDRRIRVAGSPDGLDFDPAALDMIHRFTGGIPRLINILADRCLITAYVEETRRITKQTVREAFDDLGDLATAVMPGAVEDRRPTPPGVPSPRPRVSRGVSWTERPRPDRNRWIAVAGVGMAVALLAFVSIGGKDVGVLPIPRLSQAGAVGEAVKPSEVHAASEGAASAAEAAGSRARDLYAIHVTSFRGANRSRDFANDLRAQTGEPVRVMSSETETGRWYRILLGEYESRESALEKIDVLRQRQDATFMRPVRLVHSEEELRAAETP